MMNTGYIGNKKCLISIFLLTLVHKKYPRIDEIYANSILGVLLYTILLCKVTSYKYAGPGEKLIT